MLAVTVLVAGAPAIAPAYALDAPVSQSSAASQPDASAWAPSAKSRARLVSSGGLSQGRYEAGVEIALEGEALTYWRLPGDAGVPPSFDFSGSENLASAQVLYPAPERHDEAGDEAFGWRKGVIFPIVVTPRDATKPVTLDLKMNYAACEKICVPADGHMRLTLRPRAAAGEHASRIALWRARTPTALKDDAWRARFALAPMEGAKKPAWKLTMTPAPGPESDLFAEGPEGWYFDTKRIGDAFKVVLSQKPKTASGPAQVRFTWRGPEGAAEFQTRLDAERPSP